MTERHASMLPWAAAVLAAAGVVAPAVQAQAQTEYFPHLAVGDGWQTTFTYVNYSATSVSCQTAFYSDSGAALAIPFADVGAVSTRTDNLAAGGTIHVETQAAANAGLFSGWAEGQCAGPVKASLLYRLYNGSVAQGEAGVNAMSAPASEFVSFAQTATGVAYANPSASPATVTILALDANGNSLGTHVVMLAPNQHGAANVGPMLGLSSFTGSLEVTSSTPIVAVFVNAEAFPLFSSLPPADLPAGTPLAGYGEKSTTSTATTYYFPHFAFGGGWQSTLTYVNYSPASVTCQTTFYSDSGAALPAPFTDSAGATRTDTLAAGGELHDQTQAAATGALVTGWAEAQCSAPVKASLLYRLYSGGVAVGEAGVNAVTTPATEFASFAQTATGIAYANPTTSTATITIAAFDTAGAKLGAYQTTLAANQHGLGNIGPLLGLSSFTGSVEVTATAPIVAVLVNAEAYPVFSSLPPADLPLGTTMSGLTSSGSLVVERALAQTGMAIAMASEVLVSQELILLADLGYYKSCTTLPGGGSVGVEKPITVYYDEGCQQPFLSASSLSLAEASGGTIAITESATYHGLSGAVIGSLAIVEYAILGGSTSVTVYGTGVFTPVNGTRPAQLGLYCTLAEYGQSPCGGGIAQDFPSLGIAIGGVTTLALNLGSGESAITFTGAGSVVTGPMGSLTLANPSPNSLTIEGGIAFASLTASGGAGGMDLFPPPPTGWTLADTAHDEQFQISVADDTSRSLTLTITQLSTGVPLATGNLDHSGSGSITCSDGSVSSVANWTLLD